MQIVLSPQQSQILEALSQQGGYPSLEEAINTALILLADDVAQHNPDATPDYLAWVEQTRRKVDVGIHEANQGQFLEVEEVLSQLRQKISTARAAFE